MKHLIEYNLSHQIPGFDDLVSLSTEKESNFKIKKHKSKTRDGYSVIKYEKKLALEEGFGVFGLCRSVIVNPSNEVVCFSPVKTIKFDVFSNLYPSLLENTHSAITAEEFVEGTMINVFYDRLTGSWEISTRSIIGAASNFFKPNSLLENPLFSQSLHNYSRSNGKKMDSEKTKTFKDMFEEAACACNISIYDLDKQYSYSFVLQHPDNRIVVKFDKPQLYLVGAYSIDNKINDIKVCSYDVSDVIKCDCFKNTTVKIPTQYEWTNYNELIYKFASTNTPYDCLGVVIHNKETGERTKLRNPNYEYVRRLRGNQPKLQYQYLMLRTEGKVGDFLQYYPEHKKEFSKYRDDVHLFTDTLYKNYVACYIKKEKPLLDFAEQFRTHMYTIHQMYKTELKDKNTRVSKIFVNYYVNDMHPTLLMYCLNKFNF